MLELATVQISKFFRKTNEKRKEIHYLIISLFHNYFIHYLVVPHIFWLIGCSQ